jgi:hypothetical protein
VSKLYDSCQYVIREIDARGLDPYKSRGALALETGFLISSVTADQPDDLQKAAALREAASKILQINVPA